MEIKPNEKILQAFGLEPEGLNVRKFGSGHINNTFLLEKKQDSSKYVLQKINVNVFKEPGIIAANQRMAADYLAVNHPGYLFITPIPTVNGEELFVINNEYWRLIPFIAGSVTVDQADNPKQAYEAAKQFGRLASYLSGIDLKPFKASIPNFHNLTLRYSAFQDAIKNAEEDRKAAAEGMIEDFLRYSDIAVTYEQLKTDPEFKDRLMHHDTKINNVLLNKTTFEGICVCDLDTLMPGKIISDLGDMVRTYVCPVSEEESDFSKIVVREAYFEALMQGYLEEVGGTLTNVEKQQLFFAGKFMIYMQGIRFLTDYLNGDVYYPTRYPNHNFDRAKNQLVLLQRLIEKEPILQRIIDKCLLISEKSEQ
ncbi:Phosphotransferase enzyme family protein [Chitinophaga terrae (ex Kim and Jung 2007)]|uniref:Phosphotransferase enzyme family protein n=1 Tax=Chitinophaga terrae (ex Kim and Jung 2007) TaxID=408074 RepID=A0A1H4C4Q6_9BACT|nr:aminoglycoside phosphotransferase family protein [Chitinophaga terrae (ex Kim and Jung 2007)]GEP92220.1 aminoglycoside phosphotransferase [Chitinophaga terrae (ex Kim and Jung 2007)]SEA55334.1 Phosphotransferase enzyme family protein [Chitinophaga terrae (ex Kim and Jung 2007)]